MVRKQTWILLVVFVILLGAAFYLQKNPLPKAESATPSPTAQAQMIPGLAGDQIVKIELKDGQGNATQIEQDPLGNWALGPDGKQKIDTGVAEQARAGLTSAMVQASLPAGMDLKAISLNAPTHTITVTTKDGKQTVILVGSETPTASGYYIQVDNQAPVVVDKGAIDSLVNLLNKDSLITPTPLLETTGTLEVTPTK